MGTTSIDPSPSSFLSVRLSVWFVEHTLCTTSMVQSYVVQQPPALCTMVHKGDLVLLGVNTPGEVQVFEPILASCKSESIGRVCSLQCQVASFFIILFNVYFYGKCSSSLLM